MEEPLAPLGFRFYPTEEELVSFYLHNKLVGRREDLNRVMDRVIPVLDIYEYSPWELPAFSGDLCHGDREQWFFFVPRQESEARGGRPRRLTNTGYWKATGSPGYVYSCNNRIIGVKRTMVFYRGRAPDGKKTDWKMNEYKAIEGEASTSNPAIHPNLKEEFSICRVYKRAKCLRTFDRRPYTGVMTGPQTMQLQIPNDETATTSQQNAARNLRGSPDDSSSSGDPGNLFVTGESGSASMDIAFDHDEPACDWSQLDFFDEMP